MTTMWMRPSREEATKDIMIVPTTHFHKFLTHHKMGNAKDMAMITEEEEADTEATEEVATEEEEADTGTIEEVAIEITEEVVIEIIEEVAIEIIEAEMIIEITEIIGTIGIIEVTEITEIINKIGDKEGINAGIMFIKDQVNLLIYIFNMNS